MEENKIISPQIKGIMIALVLIILSIAGYYSGLGFSNWYNWIVNGVMVIALIIACVHFANQKEGFVTFGKVFMHGFLTTIVIIVIMLVYTVIAFKVLFPDMQEKIFEMQTEQLEKQDLGSEQMEQATTMMKKFFWPFLIMAIIFGNMIFGCIASLIGAAIAKKNKVNPLDQFPR
ncbi:MAG TPA: DUF4199 domain-containing protein [Chitinophagaceae bacterium]|nr:DUF4199 domain-containing protein [Chitinophagaceae bacterium]